MSSDQIRRALRKQLHQARCADNDHSEERYVRDSFWLDAELKRLGAYAYPTTWGGVAKRWAVKQATGLQQAIY